ncbi:protoheme IX farnesyltransferase [Aureimonas fodinaquatilis]|uniref:Protoheme IX farnesyltransferase n=1 Tax=Aureimonas fodinaquatilis TaxID=2565783 RepID=A0A5B0E2D8_9HYPH|nr:protoheme IX farnesyltransferase [Aureimonas fodinaquatilis]KAA0972482.1 protoheme IX farnesyltransferase [Aureimonas fodinaquatilis]
MADEPIILTPEERKAQRKRSIAIGLFLAVLVVVFYVVAVIKIGDSV